MNRWKLLLWTAIVVTTVGSTVAVASAAQAHWRRVSVHTKAQAERNVLRAAPYRWSHRRMGGLIDKQTGLLRNNVQVVCKGRGMRLEGRYQSFICMVGRHSDPQVLLVSYRALSSGRFRMHRLVLRRR